MIIVKLMGGLGNQMFQYAAGLRLAEKHRTELKLDLSLFNRWSGSGTRRFYELSHLKVRSRVASERELAEALGAPGILGGVMSLWKRRRPFFMLKEAGVQFQPAVLEAPDWSYLDGYWQSEKYFSDIRDLLVGDFTVRTPPEGLNRDLAQEIQGTVSVSLHIRRQDYVTDPATNSTHGVCGLEYYQAAAAALTTRIEQPTFFVFSDDIEWARNNLSLARPATFVGHNGPRSGHEDMRLMSLCKHNIIANSSFSWWAAWLNQNQEKIVIAPERWYLRPELDTRDVIPHEWLRL